MKKLSRGLLAVLVFIMVAAGSLTTMAAYKDITDVKKNVRTKVGSVYYHTERGGGKVELYVASSKSARGRKILISTRGLKALFVDGKSILYNEEGSSPLYKMDAWGNGMHKVGSLKGRHILAGRIANGFFYYTVGANKPNATVYKMKLSTGKSSVVRTKSTLAHLSCKNPVLISYAKKTVSVVNPKTYKTISTYSFPAGYEQVEVKTKSGNLIFTFMHVTYNDDDTEKIEKKVLKTNNAGKNGKWI